MSKIILQTMVKNLLNNGRKIGWLGKHGQFVGGKDSVIVEGAYPSACERKNGAATMQKEIDEGWVDVTLITNLSTAKPLDAKKPKATAKPGNKITKTDPVEAHPKKESRFVTGSLEDIGKPPIATLPGAPDLPTLPEKVEIFKDGGQPVGEEMVEIPDYIKQADEAPKGTTKPEGGENHLLTEEAKADDEKKNSTPKKKKTTRRKSTKKKAEDKPAE